MNSQPSRKEFKHPDNQIRRPDYRPETAGILLIGEKLEKNAVLRTTKNPEAVDLQQLPVCAGNRT